MIIYIIWLKFFIYQATLWIKNECVPFDTKKFIFKILKKLIKSKQKLKFEKMSNRKNIKWDFPIKNHATIIIKTWDWNYAFNLYSLFKFKDIGSSEIL